MVISKLFSLKSSNFGALVFFSVTKWQRLGKQKTLATNTSNNNNIIIKFYVPIWSTT
jgi:hypothetical protein